MVKRHTVHTRDRRYRTPSYERGRDGSSSGKSLFFPASHPKDAEHVRISSPSAAHESTRWLREEWNRAENEGNRARRRLLIQEANAARNRARVGSTNDRFSSEERAQMKEIDRIYTDFLDVHKLT